MEKNESAWYVECAIYMNIYLTHTKQTWVYFFSDQESRVEYVNEIRMKTCSFYFHVKKFNFEMRKKDI